MLLFSIIVPTAERPTQLDTCLHALVHQDYCHDCFEVIVVDDGSQKSATEVVASLVDQLDVTLLTQPHAGPATARNTGAARARGKFLAFTDDDCVPASDWLKNLAARFAETPEHIIGGRTLNALPTNPYSSTSQVIIDVVYGYYNADPNEVRFLTTNNFALPTNRFRALGGFDPTFVVSEDREFCDRWLHHGYRMTYAPEVVVHHMHHLSLRGLWRQHFNYGRGAFHFHQVRARRGWGRFRPELGFYVDLLPYPLANLRGPRALLLETLLMVAQVANAAGFLWQGTKRAEKTSSAVAALS
jgi:glycosyltransferase involved in cell wall biosynthesis